MQRRLQSVVNQTFVIIKREIGIIDDRGNILASSFNGKIGLECEKFSQIEKNPEDYFYDGEYFYYKLKSKGKTDIVTYLRGEESEENKKILALFAINSINMKKLYDEKYDKLNFFKNILMDNILPGDVPIRARELNIQNNISRIVYLIKIEKNSDIILHDLLTPLFQDRNKEFVVSIDEETCVVIKQLDVNGNVDNQNKTIKKVADFILERMKKVTNVKVSIGIGFPARRIKDIGTSYKEAQIALFVGGIFYNEKSILNYTKLGIGRLIYQLPKTLCKLFLEEVFRDKMEDILDHETLITFDKLCECSFNLSETARALFMHRNTLIYRIDKVREATNLDFRNFEDAVVFKVAMLVKKYLESAEDSVY
jgi:carbohydrate diacid regulator